LQAVPGVLARHEVPRQLMQLTMDERHELLERGGVAIRPGSEQRGHVW